MNSLRFLNPDLQARFIEALRDQGLGAVLQSDGGTVFEDAQKNAVVAVAHTIRDSCFKWYFTWCDSPEATEEMKSHLLANNLRFELEDHGDRLVFLLPKEDEAKHAPEINDSDPRLERCSFCGKPWTEVQRLITSNSAAICDACVKAFHREKQK